MKQRILRALIKQVLLQVNNEISNHAATGFYGAGLSSEGYAGGYRDALHDIELCLSNVMPNRRHYWNHADCTHVSLPAHGEAETMD